MQRGRAWRRGALAVAIATFGAGAVTVGTGAPGAAVPAAREPVRRVVLAQAAPANAPGQELFLQRVEVDPGAALPEHHHAGTQIAAIRAGVLTFEVVTGTLAVTRADGSTEAVEGPATIRLRKGDSIVEDESVVHHSANRGKRMVVIDVATLLHTGEPFATLTDSDDPDGSRPTAVRLETTLTSEARTLHQVGADGESTYGWNRLTGTATLDGAPVAVEMLGSVDYTRGDGPFAGFITFTFADGATLGVSMQGRTVAAPDTADATFAATLGVIGGTGPYVAATGTGTFLGDRPASLGGQVTAVFDLRLRTP